MKRIAVMYKIINGKRVPICDYQGTCSNKAYKEVYPMPMSKKGWSYLSKKHFELEQKRLGNKLPYCSI